MGWSKRLTTTKIIEIEKKIPSITGSVATVALNIKTIKYVMLLESCIKYCRQIHKLRKIGFSIECFTADF